jgi:hypothetical protein
MVGTITVTILNWDKWNFRKDMRSPSWFRFGHDFFEDPQFFDFTHAEIAAWLYILCQASKSKSNLGEILINTRHLERIGRITQDEFQSALRKLENNQIIKYSIASPNADVTDQNVSGTAPNADERMRSLRTDGRTDTNTARDRADAPKPGKQAYGALPCFATDPEIKTLLETVGEASQKTWLSLYDEQWIKRELVNARLWMIDNPERKPKSKVSSFLSRWLKRGYEDHRKTVPTNKKSKPQLSL